MTTKHYDLAYIGDTCVKKTYIYILYQKIKRKKEETNLQGLCDILNGFGV